MMDLSTTGQTLLNAANTMTAMRWSCRTNGGEYVGAYGGPHCQALAQLP